MTKERKQGIFGVPSLVEFRNFVWINLDPFTIQNLSLMSKVVKNGKTLNTLGNCECNLATFQLLN